MTGDQRATTWPLWMRIASIVLILVALTVPMLLWRDDLMSIFADRQRVVEEIRGAGVWGPLVVIGLAIVQTLLAPIPGQVTNFVAGYIYGLWAGSLYSWIGQMVGTTIAMLLARYAGRPAVERLVSPALLKRVDRLAAGRGLSFFFLCFLIPGLPDDVICFVAGLTVLPLRLLIPMAMVARLPGLVTAVWLGARAEALPWPVWLVLGALGLMALIVFWRYGERIQDALMQRIGGHERRGI